MSGLILDTSIIIELERGNRNIIQKMDELKTKYPAPPKISFITYFEFIYGLRKMSAKNKEKSLAFVGLFEVIQTTKKTANFLALLKEKYELSLTDLFIASQTIEDKGILITKDKDFEGISEIDKIFF